MTAPDELDNEVAAALRDVRAREQEQATAAAKLEAAQGDYDRALARLREEFGVATAAEAKALYDSLGADLRGELNRVTAELAVADPEKQEVT